MAKAWNLFWLACVSACVFLSSCNDNQVGQPLPLASIQKVYREGFRKPVKPDSTENQKLYWWTQRWLDVRETDGNNRSPIIDEWNRAAGVPVGSNWCGSFVYAGQNYMGWRSPSAPAWTPAWNIASERINKTQVDTGDKFLLFYPNLGRIGHIGYVIDVGEYSVVTSEGNTNVQGSRTGIGVFNRRRPMSSVREFVRWKG